MEKKNLKNELKGICQEGSETLIIEEENKQWDGRFFIGDTELDEFAKEYDLCQDNTDDPEDFSFNQEKVEKACDCRLVYDYEGSNHNRLFGDQEIIFNEEKELYLVADEDEEYSTGCDRFWSDTFKSVTEEAFREQLEKGEKIDKNSLHEYLIAGDTTCYKSKDVLERIKKLKIKEDCEEDCENCELGEEYHYDIVFSNDVSYRCSVEKDGNDFSFAGFVSLTDKEAEQIEGSDLFLYCVDTPEALFGEDYRTDYCEED